MKSIRILWRVLGVEGRVRVVKRSHGNFSQEAAKGNEGRSEAEDSLIRRWDADENMRGREFEQKRTKIMNVGAMGGTKAKCVSTRGRESQEVEGEGWELGRKLIRRRTQKSADQEMTGRFVGHGSEGRSLTTKVAKVAKEIRVRDGRAEAWSADYADGTQMGRGKAQNMWARWRKRRTNPTRIGR